MISEKLTCFSVIIACLFSFASSKEGGSGKYTTGLIHGGEYAKIGQWPWLCAIHDSVSDEFFCGSTLISKKHVLTGECCVNYRRSTEDLLKLFKRSVKTNNRDRELQVHCEDCDRINKNKINKVMSIVRILLNSRTLITLQITKNPRNFLLSFACFSFLFK
jgi:secreted trypsin-like serine protease